MMKTLAIKTKREFQRLVTNKIQKKFFPDGVDGVRNQLERRMDPDFLGLSKMKIPGPPERQLVGFVQVS